MNAEATASRPRSGGGAHWLTHLLSVHALLVILILLIVVFSILKPNTFPTQLNFRGILDTKAIVCLVSLGILVPLTTNQFDLSAGYIIALTNSLAIGLQVKAGAPWEVAVVVPLLAGLAVGIGNGILVAYARIDSFIATLGSGTVIYGLANWYTNGEQLAGQLDPGFVALVGLWNGVPKVAFYALVVAVVLWAVLEYLPFGRYMYAVGANRRAAELSGIDARRRILIAFAISGFLAAIAGVLLAAQLQMGGTNTGPDFLLPVFAAALLGSTSVRPGRVNVWGTVIAVLLLAVAVSGLQQLGSSFYIEYIFNGGILVVAVGLAGFVGRRRAAARRAEALRHAAGLGAETPKSEGNRAAG
jgi:ribose transport system permease protein